MGKTGRMVADALKFFGAEVSYFSRHRKADADNAGFVYMPLDELLDKNEIICTCIPRNNYLLEKREFSILGNNKNCSEYFSRTDIRCCCHERLAE